MAILRRKHRHARREAPRGLCRRGLQDAADCRVPAGLSEHSAERIVVEAAPRQLSADAGQIFRDKRDRLRHGLVKQALQDRIALGTLRVRFIVHDHAVQTVIRAGKVHAGICLLYTSDAADE